VNRDERRASVTQPRTDVTSREAVPPSDTTVDVERRRRLRRVSIPGVLWFPILVVVAVLVLGGLGLSGSSASLYAGPSADGGIVAGRARDLRTDEWWVRTPLVARQAALDLPERSRIGVGEHDMAVVSDLPTRGWETFVRPHTLPYHVFGLERAFALEWWINFLALPAIGVYLLAWVLGVRPLTAAMVALVVAWSPFVQWWTSSWTGTIGYATLAGAALLGATRVRSMYARIGFAALAGWLGACLVTVLYPSTVIPTAFVVGVVVIAAVATTFPPRERRREWWLGLLVILGVAVVVGGALLGAFFLAHREALSAIGNSVYPGIRRSVGGTGHLGVLFGAPFDLIESTRSAVVVSINGLNQSEASAGLFTIFAVAAAVVVDRTRISGRPWRSRVVLLAVLGASAVLLAWYALPVPEAVGRLLLFDRVRPDRLLLPLAIASALALGLYFEERRRSTRKPLIPVVAGALAFAVPTLWAGANLKIDGQSPPLWQVLLLAAASTLGVAVALRGSRVGLWLLVALFAASAAAINPLQHGLDALLEHPSAQLGRELRARPGTGAVLNFWGDDITARSGLTVSGVDLVSGVNLYPNAAAWHVLDPGDRYRNVWDSYNNAQWSPGPAGSSPRITGTGDTIYVRVDPCDPRLARLGVRTIVSVTPMTDPCLVQTDNVPPLFAYRIDRSTGR
jgi:hypothetical protein